MNGEIMSMKRMGPGTRGRVGMSHVGEGGWQGVGEQMGIEDELGRVGSRFREVDRAHPSFL